MEVSQPVNVPRVNHEPVPAVSPGVMHVACVLLDFLARLAFGPDRNAWRRVAWLLYSVIILVIVIRVPVPAELPALPWLP
jgi:hypothetical protein